MGLSDDSDEVDEVAINYKNHVTDSLITSVIKINFEFRLCSVKGIIARYAIQNMFEKLLFAVAKPQSCINIEPPF